MCAGFSWVGGGEKDCVMDAQAHDWQVFFWKAPIKLNQWLGFVGARKNEFFFFISFFKWQIILHSSIDAEIESEQSLA